VVGASAIGGNQRANQHPRVETEAHGVDSQFVTGLLQLCGITIIAALLITTYGLLRSKASE
jgi:hypothetical protein